MFKPGVVCEGWEERTSYGRVWHDGTAAGFSDLKELQDARHAAMEPAWPELGSLENDVINGGRDGRQIPDVTDMINGGDGRDVDIVHQENSLKQGRLLMELEKNLACLLKPVPLRSSYVWVGGG